ncbi:MAG TPA: YceI family protein [Solirubrobacteraceae bacterium]|nr:YceI family protein [Solirubrobacteraceae bacterium]
MSTATIAPTGIWTVDASHSKVGFAVKHMGIATVRGEFKEFEGAFEIGEDLSQSRACGRVKASSVDTNEPARDEHLRSADFFNAATQGDLVFESTAIEQVDDQALRISGNLTINGITREETFHAELQGTDTDPWGNERVGLEVTGQISRGDYGMKFNQLLGSGNTLVGDRVKIALDISAVNAS